MQIASQVYGIRTASNGLCFSNSGQSVYITKRFDVINGVKTEVFVITSIKDDVLRIRNGSFYSGPGDYTLFILDGDMLHPRQVHLGECNYDYIEVISGLESGEQVVVSDMTKYKGKEKLKVQ